MSDTEQWRGLARGDVTSPVVAAIPFGSTAQLQVALRAAADAVDRLREDRDSWRRHAELTATECKEKAKELAQKDARIATLEAENATLTHKALRFDLDVAGIQRREMEAVELVEARAYITKLQAQYARVVRLLNDNPNAYASDLLACLNDEAKADRAAAALGDNDGR